MSSPTFSWDNIGDGIDVIEFFSGVGRIAKIASAYGFLSRAYDINMDKPPPGDSAHSQLPKRSAFDMNGEAGFLPLGYWVVFNFTQEHLSKKLGSMSDKLCVDPPPCPCKALYHDDTSWQVVAPAHNLGCGLQLVVGCQPGNKQKGRSHAVW